MPRRVLVVEDDPTLRRVIQDNLVSEGYDVEVVADGACAIRSTRVAAPDLIILDLTLPDCDGLDLLPIVRLSGQVPIIILTARAEQFIAVDYGVATFGQVPEELELAVSERNSALAT